MSTTWPGETEIMDRWDYDHGEAPTLEFTREYPPVVAAVAAPVVASVVITSGASRWGYEGLSFRERMRLRKKATDEQVRLCCHGYPTPGYDYDQSAPCNLQFCPDAREQQRAKNARLAALKEECR